MNRGFVVEALTHSLLLKLFCGIYYLNYIFPWTMFELNFCKYVLSVIVDKSALVSERCNFLK